MFKTWLNFMKLMMRLDRSLIEVMDIKWNEKLAEQAAD